jgi:hypothetical protein
MKLVAYPSHALAGSLAGREENRKKSIKAANQ